MSGKKEIVHFKVVDWVLEYAEFEELFITFLCEEGIFFQYISNLKKYPYHFEDTILSIYEQLKAIESNENAVYYLKDFIRESLHWSRCPEGSYFWAEIDSKFMVYYFSSPFYLKYSLMSNSNLKN